MLVLRLCRKTDAVCFPCFSFKVCALNRSKQLEAANEIEGFPIRKCNSVYIQTFS